MKNVFYFLILMLLSAACSREEPLPQMESQLAIVKNEKKLREIFKQESVIGVSPIDRELYEYSVKVTGEGNKELEIIFAEYKKEYGEEFPATMQLSVIEDSRWFITGRRPIPCICRPRLIPDEYLGKLKIEEVLINAFAYDPSGISIELVNESGDVIFVNSKPEKTKGVNQSVSVKLVQISEIKGKEFFINVNTNYLVKEKVMKKSLQYSVSEKML